VCISSSLALPSVAVFTSAWCSQSQTCTRSLTSSFMVLETRVDRSHTVQKVSYSRKHEAGSAAETPEETPAHSARPESLGWKYSCKFIYVFDTTYVSTKKAIRTRHYLTLVKNAAIKSEFVDISCRDFTRCVNEKLILNSLMTAVGLGMSILCSSPCCDGVKLSLEVLERQRQQVAMETPQRWGGGLWEGVACGVTGHAVAGQTHTYMQTYKY